MTLRSRRNSSWSLIPPHSCVKFSAHFNCRSLPATTTMTTNDGRGRNVYLPKIFGGEGKIKCVEEEEEEEEEECVCSPFSHITKKHSILTERTGCFRCPAVPDGTAGHLGCERSHTLGDCPLSAATCWQFGTISRLLTKYTRFAPQPASRKCKKKMPRFLNAGMGAECEAAGRGGSGHDEQRTESHRTLWLIRRR